MENGNLRRPDTGQATEETFAEECYRTTTELIVEAGSSHVIQDRLDSDVCKGCRTVPWNTVLVEDTYILSEHCPMSGSARIQDDLVVEEIPRRRPPISHIHNLSVKSSAPTQLPCHICRWVALLLRSDDAHTDDYRFKLSRRERLFHPAGLERKFENLQFMTGSPKFSLIQFRENWPGYPVSKRGEYAIIARYVPTYGVSEARYRGAPYVDLSQINVWIEECEKKHCNDCFIEPIKEGKLHSLRVIDCEQNVVVSAPRQCSYIALSYVWGTHSRVTEDLGSPPKTVADSIYLTKQLGHRYLWIDKYCIDQNDHADKHAQILQMASIYAAAQITIVAAAGSDPTHGLPGIRARSRNSSSCQKIGDVLLSLCPRLRCLTESKWASRAWTFQEFHFSRRRLILTDSDATFICNTSIRHELPLYCDTPLPETETPAWTRSISQKQDIQGLEWLKLQMPPCAALKSVKNDRSTKHPIDLAADYLQAYSRRELTHDSDAVNAIAGALYPLVQDFVYHAWGLPFRCRAAPATHVSAFNLSSAHGVCNLSNVTTGKSEGRSVRLHSSLSSTYQTTKCSGKMSREPTVPVPPEEEEEEMAEMALLWYHWSPSHRRTHFPSWSPLGWVGDLSWMDNGPRMDAHVTLAHACRAKIHVSGDVFGVPQLRSEHDCDIFSKPRSHAILEIHLKTACLEIGAPETESYEPYFSHLVALELANDCSIVFPVFADTDLEKLGTNHLTGALIHGISEESPQAFVMLLATRGEVLERVGLFELPGKLAHTDIYDPLHFDTSVGIGSFNLRKDRRRHLPGYDEKEAARELCESYPTDFGAWWQHIFKDNGPIKIR